MKRRSSRDPVYIPNPEITGPNPIVEYQTQKHPFGYASRGGGDWATVGLDATGVIIEVTRHRIVYGEAAGLAASMNAALALLATNPNACEECRQQYHYRKPGLPIPYRRQTRG